MKRDYSFLTDSCLSKKERTADNYQHSMIQHLELNDIELKFNYQKEMADVKKVLTIKNEILDASRKFDKLVHQFYIDIPKIIFIDYDNCSKYVSMFCDQYNICNDIRNIILHFTIDKTYYNSEIRKTRKTKKILSSNNIERTPKNYVSVLKNQRLNL